MKHLWIVLLLFMSLSGHAQILRRQSLFSVVAMVDRVIHPHVIPYRGYSWDLTDKESQEELEFLSLHSNFRHPNLETTFSFTNKRDNFVGLFRADMGVCRGYSSLRRKFRLLAFFDPENKSGEEIPDRELHPKKWLKFYKRKVRSIRFHQATVIPGFKNLQEFSSDPKIKEMLMWQVFYEWSKKNFARGTGTWSLLRGTWKKTPYEELLQLRERIADWRDLNLNTMVWLSVKRSTWIHVLEAIDVSEVGADGSFMITFWNDKFIEIEKARSYLYVSADGSMTYDDGIEARTIHGAGIAQENDGELFYMAENIKQFCQAQPYFCLPR